MTMTVITSFYGTSHCSSSNISLKIHGILTTTPLISCSDLYCVVLMKSGFLMPLESQADFDLRSLNSEPVSLPLSYNSSTYNFTYKILQIKSLLRQVFHYLSKYFLLCIKSYPRTSHNTSCNLNSCCFCVKVANFYFYLHISEFQFISLIYLQLLASFVFFQIGFLTC